ncbi:ketoacyl-synt-domain-containing protein [Trametes coccinea BRFM310]|uniref:Ketoacyl-synt-domain-containing protein n=1 Tax=Trametes coccinea (strain BRFM310) TaxID=1353009 RepID=A0A1Y2J660_TRAC3|nr:ketoacyl-synt-domain-containing protein [Trametes coccinea BRFM310]
MAVELPGAEDTNSLWTLLREGLNTVEQIPLQRFDVDAVLDGFGRSVPATKGNFLADVDAFDNAFFHISPREARSMDPQQRVLLRTAYHALEDAGYTPGATPGFDPDSFATFIGVATEDYVHNLRNNIDVYYSTGTLRAFLSGRISYAFGFGGPSIALDTACSSSIVAFHQAYRALMAGDCNAALAGGVNIVSSPDMYAGLARGHFLSETGQCRPWDASADGYCRAEGCGIFVLKRLKDAIAENDRIHAVIRGIEVNHSGQARSITHPHVPAQVALLEKLVSSAGVHPHDVNVAECHGTGTQAGDPAELEAVRKVFAVDRAQDNPLHITSVKANIGHAEAASGTASLAKLILMMRERAIPRHISFQKLNPRIPDLAIDNVSIDTTMVPWERRRDTRLALLTNFGAAGSNGALILQEYMPAGRLDFSQDHVVLAIEQRRQDYLSQLEELPDDVLSLKDFAYSATARRQLHGYRIAVSGNNKSEVLDALLRPPSGIIFHLGMAADLYQQIPLFGITVDECHDVLLRTGHPGIHTVFQRSREENHLAMISAFNPALFRSLQVALFVLEYALARVWMSWGVKPCAVVGHSYGEFAALTIAGVLSLKDALDVVARRAEWMSTLCKPYQTGMSSIRASADDLAPILGRHPFSHLEICCYNSASNFVVGGSLEELQAFEDLVASRGVRFNRLDVPFAYHSAAMDGVFPKLEAYSGGVFISPPKIPVLSNVTGTLVQPGDVAPFSRGYFSRHCREPARFQQGIASMTRDLDLSSIAAIIEVGPHPTTIPLLRSLLTDGAPLLLPSLRKDAPELEMMSAALAQLYCTNVPILWRTVFRDLLPEARLVDLPAYPFAKTRFWVPYDESSHRRAASDEEARTRSTLSGNSLPLPRFSLLDRCAPSPLAQGSDLVTFETRVESLAELLQGHRVAGIPLCPASVHAELALAAGLSVWEAQSHSSADDALELADVVYPKPLVYAPDRQDRLCICVDFSQKSDKFWASFTVSTATEGTAKPVIFCRGSLKNTTQEKLHSKFGYLQTTVKREILAIQDHTSPAYASETFSARTVYDLLFPSIVSYSEAYRVIKTIVVNPSTFSAYAVIQLPSSMPAQTFAITHPIFIDALFHTAGFLVNFARGMNGTDAYICSSVHCVQLVPGAVDLSGQYGVYATVVQVEDAGGSAGAMGGEVVVADVYAVEVDDPRGRIVARLKRARFRKIALGAFKRALQSAASVPSSSEGSSRDENRTRILLSSLAPEANAGTAVRTRDLLHIIAEATGIPQGDLHLDARLAHLGIDSLMLWEVAARLRAIILVKAERELDARGLSEATTLGDLVACVRAAYGEDASLAETSTEDSIATLCEDLPSGSSAQSPGTAATKAQSPKDIDIHAVRSVLSSVLDIPAGEISEVAQLQHLGLDSLTAIEAKHVFRTRLAVDVDEDILFGCHTVQDVVHALLPRGLPSMSAVSPDLQETRGKKPSTADSEQMLLPPRFLYTIPSEAGFDLVQLQSAPSGCEARPPLILIHDGSGTASSYARFASLGRDVWAIRNLNLMGSLLDAAGRYEALIPSLAAAYSAAVRTLLYGDEKGGSSGGAFLGGWSFGGVLAYELAIHLQKLGIPVKGVILLDAPAPQTRRPLPMSLINTLAARVTGSFNAERDDLAGQLRVASQALVAYHTASVGGPEAGSTTLRAIYVRARDAVDDDLLGGVVEENVDERVYAFLTKRQDEWTVPQWTEALGAPTMEVREVPGDHFSMFNRENIGLSRMWVNGSQGMPMTESKASFAESLIEVRGSSILTIYELDFPYPGS